MELVINKSDKDYKKILELINDINMKLQDYELIVNVKPDVFTLFNTGFTQTDFSNMYEFSYFMSYYLKISNLAGEVKYRFKSVYTNDDFDAMTNFVNWLESIYVKLSELKAKITELFTTTYTNTDYENMTGLNTYLLSLLNNSIKLPIFMGFRDSSYNEVYGTDYINKINWESNSTRGCYVCFAPNKAYNNNFNHLFIWKNLDSSITTGAISNYINFIPTSTLKPFILFFGDRSVSVSGTAQFVIQIGKKKIIINFTPGSWTNQSSVVHLSFQQHNMINFNDFINRIPYTASQNPFNFDVSDFTGSSTGDYNIWSTSNGYKSYDYNTESDTLTINAGRYTNAQW